MHMWLKALLLLLLLLEPSLRSQETTGLTRVTQIGLKEHPDSVRLFSASDEDHGRHAPLFSVAVTPGHDLLAVIGERANSWHIIRIKNWLASKPVVEHLDVPGYSTPPFAGDFSIKPQIIITPDGRYLITVAPEPWPQKQDATVNEVDLQTFHIVTTQRASEHGYRSDWRLDAESGFLQVHGLTPSPSKPPGSEQWLTFLSLPSLEPLERCDYAVVFNPPSSAPTALGSTTTLRADFHATPSAACARAAQDRLDNQDKPDELQALGIQMQPGCGVEAMTPDHDYAVGTCRNCHQGFLGVSCKSEESEIYEVATKKKVASLSHAPRKYTEALLTSLEGKLYVLALENAEKLIIYRVTAVP